MIRVITPDVAHFFQREIESMHRLRHRVFRERLKWDVVSHDGMERDEFDECSPIYLIAGEREVLGTWRLLPTTGPYMLADVFSQLLEGAPPLRKGSLWEASRFAVEVGADESDGLAALSRTTMELCCGIVEFGIAKGISEFLTVYDARVARLLSRIGHHPKWRSKPMRIGNALAVAGLFDTNPRVLSKLREISGIHEPVLTWDGAREAA